VWRSTFYKRSISVGAMNRMQVESPNTAKTLVIVKESSVPAEPGYEMTYELKSALNLQKRFSEISLSPLALKVTGMARDERLRVRDLTQIVSGEPRLAARLLKVINVASGLPPGLSAVSEAVEALGWDTVKSLVLGLSVYPLDGIAEDKMADTDITLRHFWEHSLGCAAIAGNIALKVDRRLCPTAFVSGFLHDLGSVIFLLHLKERLLQAVSVAADKNLPIREAETLALGVEHADVGALWARKGGLPLIVQQIIRYHHEPLYELPHWIDAEAGRALLIVRLADLLCGKYGIGTDGDNEAISKPLWNTLGIRELDYSELETVKQRIEGMREDFTFDRDPPKPRCSTEQNARKTKDQSSRRQKAAPGGTRGQVIRFPVSGHAHKTAGDESKAPRKKLTILIVEDHGSLCEMLSLYFMRFGYHVRTANDGESALQTIANEEIHLVLLDLMLPRLDGFTVLKQLRETPGAKTPYVIVVSAGASERDRNKVLELGANEYMPKPFHLARLIERIQMVEKYLL
jgi:CheY-like chemotaxis protein/HD-like signal output (HDOD) protein